MTEAIVWLVLWLVFIPAGSLVLVFGGAFVGAFLGGLGKGYGSKEVGTFIGGIIGQCLAWGWAVFCLIQAVIQLVALIQLVTAG